MRSLTKNSDKLAAISGISSQLPQGVLGDYHFGIWEKYCLHDLLWSTVFNSRRPSDSIAPSWSWASPRQSSDSLTDRHIFPLKLLELSRSMIVTE